MGTQITVQTDRRAEMEIAHRFYGGHHQGGMVRVFCKDRETAMTHWGAKRVRENGRVTGQTFSAWVREQERAGYTFEFKAGER